MNMKKSILTSAKDIADFFVEIGREEMSDGCVDFSCKSIAKKSTFKSKSAKFKRYAPKAGDRYIDGYATTPDVDWVKDVVSMQAIEKSQNDLLRQGTNTVFYNHDTDMPIGKVVGAGADKKGLFVQILISKAKDVADIWTKLKEKILSSFSIRFKVNSIEVVRGNDGDIIEYTILDMDMLEVSVVGLPMNKEAGIVNVMGKSLSNNKGEKKMNGEKVATITEVVKELLPEMLKSELSGAVKEAIDGMEAEKAKASELDKIKSENETMKKELEDLKKAGSEGKENKEPSELDKLKSENEKVKKELDELKASRKGNESNEDEGEEGDEGEAGIVKSLKSVDDEATCVFVLKAMDSEDIYNGLTDSEKKKCRHLYFQMMKKVKE